MNIIREEYIDGDNCKELCPFAYLVDKRYVVIDVRKCLRYKDVPFSGLEKHSEEIVEKLVLEDWYRPKLRHPQVQNWVIPRYTVFPDGYGIDEVPYIVMDCAIKAYFRLQKEKKL